jgi:hypothetical protein
MINDYYSFESILNMGFIEAIDPHFKFHCHVDMGIAEDAAGIAIGAVVGSVSTEKEFVVDEDTNELVEKVSGTSPVYVIFGLLRVVPPKIGFTEIDKVEKLILCVKRYLKNLASFTSDKAYSITLIQNLRKNGIATQLLSVDISPVGYIEMKNSLSAKRLWVPEHTTFKEEIKHLIFDSEKNKIDHDRLHSKDVTDAVAGVMQVLSKRKSSYSIKTKPVNLFFLKNASENPKKQERLSIDQRPRSGNRPRRWNR